MTFNLVPDIYTMQSKLNYLADLTTTDQPFRCEQLHVLVGTWTTSLEIQDIMCYLTSNEFFSYLMAIHCYY